MDFKVFRQYLRCVVGVVFTRGAEGEETRYVYKDCSITVVHMQAFVYFGVCVVRHILYARVCLHVDELLWVLLEADTTVYLNFMKSHTCYDAIPISCKLVIFDTTLQVSVDFSNRNGDARASQSEVYITYKVRFC